jgi:hypothetical protein
MWTYDQSVRDSWTYVTTEAVVALASSDPQVNKCPIPEPEDFRYLMAESLSASRVKGTQGWSANGPDGSCGGMVSRRSLKGGTRSTRSVSARSVEVSTIPMQVDLRVHDDVALGEIELYAEVLATVAASDGPLSKSELDEALGIRRR